MALYLAFYLQFCFFLNSIMVTLLRHSKENEKESSKSFVLFWLVKNVNVSYFGLVKYLLNTSRFLLLIGLNNESETTVNLSKQKTYFFLKNPEFSLLNFFSNLNCSSTKRTICGVDKCECLPIVSRIIQRNRFGDLLHLKNNYFNLFECTYIYAYILEIVLL